VIAGKPLEGSDCAFLIPSAYFICIQQPYFIPLKHFDRWRGKGIVSAETEDAQFRYYRISKPGRVSP
jgi:hypothetical protein